MNNKYEVDQLTFFTKKEIEEKPKKKLTMPYDATICDSCLCNQCNKSCEASIFLMSKEEWKQQETCWNCDECYFYGMDDPKLSQNVVKFECKKFKMMNYYVDLNARKQRIKLKIVK